MTPSLLFYYPNESTLLHLLLTSVVLNGHDNQQSIYTHCHEEEFVIAMLDAGCDKVVNHTDKKGQRPLHIIAKRMDLFKQLVNYGAHVDAVNTEGKTVLPTGTFGVPSLYCTVANAIVKYSLPYQSAQLPSHVVQFVMLHDPHIISIN